MIGYMPSLHDPELNLGRAKHYLKVLDRQITRFEKTHKLQISTEEDLNQGVYLIRARIDFPEDESLNIAVTAGDFICRLRASLDHLAWQLALYDTDKPGFDIHFPICEKDSPDTQVKIAKATFGMPDEAIPVVRSF